MFRSDKNGRLRDDRIETIVLNAANEIAVEAFLDGRVGFTDIAILIEQTLNKADIIEDVSTLDNIIEVDALARIITKNCISEMLSSQDCVTEMQS